MKHKICISIDEKTLIATKEHIRTGKYRNRSHLIEFALKKLMEVGK